MVHFEASPYRSVVGAISAGNILVFHQFYFLNPISCPELTEVLR
jgi:hypothetical protein